MPLENWTMEGLVPYCWTLGLQGCEITVDSTRLPVDQCYQDQELATFGGMAKKHAHYATAVCILEYMCTRVESTKNSKM